MPPSRLSPPPSRLDKASFVARFGGVVEHSPWVAERAWERGLGATEDTPAGLAEAMAAILRDAGPSCQLAVLRAHPDLAGKAALAGELTDASRSEQGSAGLDHCTAEELARFECLNAAYRDRFGFPFVMAVAGKDRHAILAAFEARLRNDRDAERRTAIEEVGRIARLRLEALAHDRGPAGNGRL